MITLITATGGRPEAFALCEKYIARQTYKGPTQWIVVDDCKPHTLTTLKQEYVRGPKDWKPDINTQRYNMDVAISRIKGDCIFIIEDDDYYAPNYIEAHLSLLQHVKVVGEAKSKYFNVAVPGWKIMPNLKHSSLAQTSFRKELLPTFEKALHSGNLYFDVTFWEKVHEAQTPALLATNKNLCIGIKGLPGRAGITGSHRSKDFMYDPEFKVLKEWIGNDANSYLKYKKGNIWKKPAVIQPLIEKKDVTSSTSVLRNAPKNVLKR